jgi:hypothetical protein
MVNDQSAKLGRPAAIGLAIGLALTGTSLAWAEPAPVPAPTVSAAPAVGEMWAASALDEAALGLVEEEFFFEGTTTKGEPYKSRMIVRRPADPAKFNGTVVVEWMNASSGADLDVDYASVLPLIRRQGYAYVGVTAQKVTVDFLRKRNGPRYESLTMNDDQPQNAAFEVFAQAGQALRGERSGVDPLGGLKAPQVLIAIGQSQSSGRLTTFVNSVHGEKLAPVYDAVVLHAGGSAAPTRFPLPILKLNSENEAPGYWSARVASDPNYVYWEVPGTAHQPLEGTEPSLRLLDLARAPEGFPRCPFPYQGVGGPVPIDAVLRAGLVGLDRWVRTGQPLKGAPLIEMTPPPAVVPEPAEAPSVMGPRGPRGVIVRDAYGNALGGIRLPHQEVPTGRNTPSSGCQVSFGGRTAVLGTYPQWDAFDGGKDPAVDPEDKVNATEPASAKAVYGSHEAYLARFSAAADAALADGFILEADAEAMKLEAAKSDVAK